MRTSPTKVASAISIVMALSLTACGNNNNYGVDNPTDPEPTPTPPVIEFPAQSEIPQTLAVSDTGEILATSSGLSLYFFANDSMGDSNCNGAEGDEQGSTTDANSCAGIWPPLLALEGSVATDNFTIVERDSGAQQWAYKGYPLYTYIEDSAQGDIFGDGVNGIWDLARLDPVEELNRANHPFVGNGLVKTAQSNNQVLEILRADKEEFSLYTFDVDPVGSAACYNLNGDGCINTWPPLLADGGAKPSYPLSVLSLENGQKQWAYKEKPLYFFIGDSNAYDTAGDGVNDVWHIANNTPALFRITDLGNVLSATGKILALLPDPDDGTTLIPQHADRDQFTLYTFDNDNENTSNCNGNCAVIWPAFLADERDPDVGQFTKFERADGLLQWSWDKKPLYFFDGDTDKKQTKGEGFNGVWHVIADLPAGNMMAPIQLFDSVLGESLTVSGTATVLKKTSGETDFSPVTDDFTGFQLYTFDVDEPNISNCVSEMCVSTWPPLLAENTDVAQAPFNIIERTDGYKQWAINGMPLYLFNGDTTAGQQNGEEVNNVWWVARPSPVRVYDHPEEGNLLIAHGQILDSIGKSKDQLIDLTLYTFDDDVAGSGESTCFDTCAATWPPLYAESPDEAFGEFTIISRTETDNTTTYQWTYKGLPLYFFVGDSTLGDTAGNYPTWTIARP